MLQLSDFSLEVQLISIVFLSPFSFKEKSPRISIEQKLEFDHIVYSVSWTICGKMLFSFTMT